MIVYQQRLEEDLLIADWWVRMRDDGDLDGLFTQGSRTLASLLRIVSPPKTLLYLLDDRGMWFAMWGEQFLNGAFVGMWLRQDRRRTRSGLQAFLDGADAYLKTVPVLFGVTKQAKILDEHLKLGYTEVDQVEELMDGETAWIVKLTRSALAATRARYASRIAKPEEVLT